MTVTTWLNLYADGSVRTFPTKVEADFYSRGRVACKKVTFKTK